MSSEQNDTKPQTVDANSAFVIELPPEDARSIWEQLGPKLNLGFSQQGPDTLRLYLPTEQFHMSVGPRVERLPSGSDINFEFKTTFFPTKEGLLCSIVGEELLLEVDLTKQPNFAQMSKAIGKRNKLADFKRGGQKPEPKSKNLTLDFHADEQIAQLPNSKADRDLYRGLMLYPKQWGLNEYLVNHYHNGSEGHIVTYQPSEVERALGDAPDRALSALERHFKELRSEIVADVIDILFHHWHTHKDTQTGAVMINAAKLCEYRGKVPEGENLRLHWQALRDAFSFALRDTKSDIKAKVFYADSKGENSDGPGAHYVYSPGFMLQYALNGQPLYFAPFLQKVWALDPVRNNEAKRLARYLRTDWRMNTEKYLTAESGAARAARWHSWAFLLAESGVDVENYRKKPDGKPYPDGPRRLMETMGRAVETLYEMEIIAEGGFDIYHPEDRRKAENLPKRGALDVWLTLRICLAPSAKLREALIVVDGGRRAGRARDAHALSTERAKKQLRVEGKTKSKR